MDFQRLLLEVGKALSKDEVKALAFLCADFLARNPTSVESASDLFSRLAEQDYLSPEQPDLLIELLLTIKRPRLVRDLNFTDWESATFISPYRKLLYNLSEEITDDDLKNVKFLLIPKLRRRKLEENVTTLEIFLEMEHMDLLSDTNLGELETIVQAVCPMLKDMINQYKEQPVPHTSHLTQQTDRPRSLSYTSEPNQSPMSLEVERSVSGEPSGLRLVSQSSTNSGTSVDFPDLQYVGDVQAVPHEFTGSEPHSCESPFHMRIGVTGSSFQENKMSPERQTFETTNTNTEGLGTYPMTASKRGVCLIINNYRFTNPKLKNREGTMVDEKSLLDVFKWLDFDIEIHHDCKVKEMRSILQELGRRDHSRVDCVVCCILSHGLVGEVFGVDGLTVTLKDLMQPLNGLRCPSLVEKPKLFFIQACQGTSEQRPVYIESDSPNHDAVCGDAIKVVDSIPCDADFLLAMATVPSYVSYRDRKSGTWFIQSLCQNLVQMVPRGVDLVSILTKVNADVSQMTDSTGEKKQMPQPAFSLRKKVVFPVPETTPPSMDSHIR